VNKLPLSARLRSGTHVRHEQTWANWKRYLPIHGTGKGKGSSARNCGLGLRPTCFVIIAIKWSRRADTRRNTTRAERSGQCEKCRLSSTPWIVVSVLYGSAIFNCNGGGSTSVDNTIGSADGSAAGGASEIATGELRPAMMACPLLPSLSADRLCPYSFGYPIA
jgi:hypothetical protein